MSSPMNGLRTYRPDLAHYVFPNENFRKQVQSWVDGIKSGNATRALMLTGTSGLGKTTLAKALAGELGVVDRDISQENSASSNTFHVARDLVERQFQTMPLSSPYRVFILDELHKLTEAAQEVFLTPLEENLPKTTIVMGCTSEPSLLKPAFRNRFYELKFDIYPEEMIVEILMGLPGVKHTPATLARIARVAGGVPRTAISIAEKNPDSPEMQEILSQEILTAEKFVVSLLKKDVPMLFVLAGMIKEENKRPFYEKVLRYLECIWALNRNLSIALSSSEKKFVTEWKERNVSWVYGEMVEQSQKPAGFLKAWVISGRLEAWANK